jgi:hypothetical protein
VIQRSEAEGGVCAPRSHHGPGPPPCAMSRAKSPCRRARLRRRQAGKRRYQKTHECPFRWKARRRSQG